LFNLPNPVFFLRECLDNWKRVKVAEGRNKERDGVKVK